MNRFLQQAQNIHKIALVSFLLRLLIVLFCNLGNDEVYYVSYALYPDYGHFDHPPMVGLLIRFFTANLYFLGDDFFVRLGPLLIGTFNLYLVYHIGKSWKDVQTGLIAALCLASSFYASVIAGTFILPDTPLSLFWLLSIWSFVRYLQKSNSWHLLLFGVWVGLGLCSKYQAIFLWGGAGLYFMVHERSAFLKPWLWGAGLLSLLIFSPVFYWNMTSPYSGLGYHAGRIGQDSWIPNIDYILQQVLGQIFYNNPFLVIVLLLMLFFLFRKVKVWASPALFFLLSISIPLLLLTIGMSFYSRMLPHWNGPAYFGLWLLLAYALGQQKRRGAYFIWLKLSMGFYTFVMLLGFLQIHFALIPLQPSDQKLESVGANDFLVDLGLWDEIGAALEQHFAKEDQLLLLTHNWFPAAHLDYYFALPHQHLLYVAGTYDRQHQYMKINKERGGIPKNSRMYYITSSNYYSAPSPAILARFEQLGERRVLRVSHGYNKVNIFIWELKGLKADWEIQPD